MIERATSPANIAAMLQTLRAHQAEAQAGVDAGRMAVPAGDVSSVKDAKPSFGDLVKGAVGGVNSLQLHSQRLQEAHQRGEPVALADVVLGMQKSSIAFEATLQVRNKVLKAYEDILNMPV
jgi:flagellar hook-basal body complex protein FliE